jgi:hypothetical protein
MNREQIEALIALAEKLDNPDFLDYEAAEKLTTELRRNAKALLALALKALEYQTADKVVKNYQPPIQEKFVGWSADEPPQPIYREEARCFSIAPGNSILDCLLENARDIRQALASGEGVG